MKFPTLLAVVAATLPMAALADFDMWESTASFVGPYDTSVAIQEVCTITQISKTSLTDDSTFHLPRPRV